MEAAKSRAGELLAGRQPAADPTLLQIGDPEPIPPLTLACRIGGQTPY